MSVTLAQVVPWGRSLEEYRQMFMLADEERTLKILGVGDGPASFNSEMKVLGYTVVSIDPIYALSKKQIEQRIDKTYDTVVSQVKQKPDDFVWDFFVNPKHCGCYRLETMRKFLQDYEMGKLQGRYIPSSLPNSILTMSSLIWQCVRICSFCIPISYHSVFIESPFKSSAAFHERSEFSRY